ncbi:MAG TPA: maleylpyruvate isomerase family mycothiol-dependent enzyme [Streptosporangiaceae bacterium]|nr:maleylpyruvate isomerase family mycothiol-dependent enzyme [Streptosporangiaceae bacterium]
MTIFEDLAAEQDRLEKILTGLDEAQWSAASAAEGWTVADVVLHLAQSDEAAAATATHGTLRGALDATPGDTTDERAASAVRNERAAPAEVFARWQRARQAAMAAMGAADPDRPVQWMVGTLKPATLATTRLAEAWTHGLDIAGPLGADFPDTDRLRHIAWLAHRTLPYALSLTGAPAVAVRCELTAPDGEQVWQFGPEDAESAITGTAGEFCRVAAQRLDPARSGLSATGPHGATALRVVRTYAA